MMGALANTARKATIMSWQIEGPIVVPIDFSDASFAALAKALELSSGPAALALIHVLPAIGASDPGVTWGAIDDDHRRATATEALRERAGPSYAESEAVVVIGDPGSEIADYAEQSGADLIVLPSHGRRGARRLLLGSVAERVVRLAHCAVLVLKPDHGFS